MNVFPNPALLHVPYRHRGNAQLSCDYATGAAVSADSPNSFFSQLNAAHALAVCMAHRQLSFSNVGLARIFAKMIWINAKSVMARMTGVQSAMDGSAKLHFQYYSMRQTVSTVHPNLPITPASRG